MGLPWKEGEIRLGVDKVILDMESILKTSSLVNGETKQKHNYKKNQVIIARWLAWRLATGKVPGSNPGKEII